MQQIFLQLLLTSSLYLMADCCKLFANFLSNLLWPNPNIDLSALAFAPPTSLLKAKSQLMSGGGPGSSKEYPEF